MNNIYQVVHRDFGFCHDASVHATEAGANAAAAAIGYVVLPQRWHEQAVAGSIVHVSVVPSPYDADYLDARVNTDGIGMMREVQP